MTLPAGAGRILSSRGRSASGKARADSTSSSGLRREVQDSLTELERLIEQQHRQVRLWLVHINKIAAVAHTVSRHFESRDPGTPSTQHQHGMHSACTQAWHEQTGPFWSCPLQCFMWLCIMHPASNLRPHHMMTQTPSDISLCAAADCKRHPAS